MLKIILKNIALYLFTLGFVVLLISLRNASAASSNKPLKEEVQYSLCGNSLEEILSLLEDEIQIDESKSWSQYYYETAQKNFIALGMQLRVRETKSKVQLTVKRKFQSEGRIPWSLLDGEDYKCEYDLKNEAEDLQCSLYGDDWQPSSTQLRFMGKGNSGLFRKAILLGPVNSQQTKFSVKRVDFDMVLDSLKAPSGVDYIEISSRVKQDDVEDFKVQFETWSKKVGLRLCPRSKGRHEIIIDELLKLSNR